MQRIVDWATRQHWSIGMLLFAVAYAVALALMFMFIALVDLIWSVLSR